MQSSYVLSINYWSYLFVITCPTWLLTQKTLRVWMPTPHVASPFQPMVALRAVTNVSSEQGPQGDVSQYSCMHEWSLHERYSWRAWLGGHGFPPANIKRKKKTSLWLLLAYFCCYSCHYCCFSCFNVLERWPFGTIFLRPEPLYNVSDSMTTVLLSWVTTWGRYTSPFSSQ